jgi:hypothetical protein
VALFTSTRCSCEDVWGVDVVVEIWELWLKFSYLAVTVVLELS